MDKDTGKAESSNATKADNKDEVAKLKSIKKKRTSKIDIPEEFLRRSSRNKSKEEGFYKFRNMLNRSVRKSQFEISERKYKEEHTPKNTKKNASSQSKSK
ncbi:hypothetical protein EVAR_45435_1 [Eumeta japonica]|uniref:Uncharacterized protein n=1 Tax=Eumeta variegata TaxID=151549 RepID=A0A4C1YGF3_EUMVA|nr:hypothetical protein EVAR_45435_1 [Eumeta japonica]